MREEIRLELIFVNKVLEIYCFLDILIEQREKNYNCSAQRQRYQDQSMATANLDNDFTGVSEKYAHRRVFDEEISLTFYCDAKEYLTN